MTAVRMKSGEIEMGSKWERCLSLFEFEVFYQYYEDGRQMGEMFVPLQVQGVYQ